MRFFHDTGDERVQPEAANRFAVHSSHPTNEGSDVGAAVACVLRADTKRLHVTCQASTTAATGGISRHTAYRAQISRRELGSRVQPKHHIAIQALSALQRVWRVFIKTPP